MKRLLAGGLTVLVMGLLLWLGLRRGPSTPAGPDAEVVGAGTPERSAGPEASLRALMAGAREGDVSGYLAAFAEPLRSRLEREVRERGREAFAADLREAAGARKSHAIFAPEPDGPDAVRITVESVYPDRNERQTYRLVRDGPDGWLVADVESARGREPTAKFGTLATFQGPEGVPVQGSGAAPAVEK